jgi:hypothetical protein
MPLPLAFCLGVTGHRCSNVAFRNNEAAIEAAMRRLFVQVAGAVGASGASEIRLHALLAHGADLMAAELALAQGWQVVAPLPCGVGLNRAINADPETIADAERLLAGAAPADPAVAARATAIDNVTARAKVFALGEQDAPLKAGFLASFDALDRHFDALISERAAMAGRVMVEQSDLLVAIWDGSAPQPQGGTRHSIAAMLELGGPVLWIDAAAPDDWRIIRSPEALLVPGPPAETDDVAALLASLCAPPGADARAREIRFLGEQWHSHSRRRFHAYRRVEAVFGGEGRPLRSLRQHYEFPEAVAAGSCAPLLEAARRLPGADGLLIDGLAQRVLPRFGWADGLSTFLSDAYRGGMVLNFLMSALAIIGGVSYLPLVSPAWKWPFALLELALLAAIITITTIGKRRQWHGRWFETRRVAEYLRHAPIMLLAGAARPPARWPRGGETSWPEQHAHQVLRSEGLPAITITVPYLRGLLAMIGLTAATQAIYHRGKAKRLTRVHHNLDHASERLFAAAVVSVSVFLLLVLVAPGLAEKASKLFTVFGVALPALGGAFAGIRYFGDFERFAGISEVAAKKLDALHLRVATLAAAGDPALRFGEVAALAHALDDIVIDEIQSWQQVFAGKVIAVPV